MPLSVTPDSKLGRSESRPVCSVFQILKYREFMLNVMGSAIVQGTKQRWGKWTNTQRARDMIPSIGCNLSKQGAYRLFGPSPHLCNSVQSRVPAYVLVTRHAPGLVTISSGLLRCQGLNVYRHVHDAAYARIC